MVGEFKIPKVFKEATGGLRKMKAEIKDVQFEMSKITKDAKAKPSEQLHLTLHPLDHTDWKDQNEWFGISETEDSAMTALIKRLREIGVSAPAGANIKDILMKMGPMDWKEENGIGKKQGSTWMPQAPE